MKKAYSKESAITFPCRYPIKVIGKAAPDFKTCVMDIIKHHANDIDQQAVSMRASRNSLFYALTITITATGIEQLDAIHKALIASKRVKMVL